MTSESTCVYIEILDVSYWIFVDFWINNNIQYYIMIDIDYTYIEIIYIYYVILGAPFTVLICAHKPRAKAMLEGTAGRFGQGSTANSVQ